MVLVATWEAWRVGLVWGARLIVGAILFLGGLGKVLYIRDFRKILDAYQLLPSDTVPAAAVFLVAAEVLCGISIFVTRLSTIAGLCAAGLFGVFITAISSNLLRGKRELPCGCFGKSTEVLSWMTVLRNFALIALAILATGHTLVLPFVLIAAYALALLLQVIRRTSAPVMGGVAH